MRFAELLEKHGKKLQRKRGEYLFQQGEQNPALYSVNTGLLKAYYLSVNGKESIKSFLLPGDTIGSLKGFLGEGGCSFNLMCMQDSILTSIDFKFLYSESREDHILANEMVDFLLKFAMKKENREFELLCLPADERYKRLLDSTPDLFDRVAQSEIARFLGVTPVGLSRIKKRVLKSG